MNGLIRRNIQSGGLIPRQMGGASVTRRAYNGETKILLGCGNSPAIHDAEYQAQHTHDGYYTIDIREDMNPSCLANAITDSFCDVPDNSIDEIIAEGFGLHYNQRDNLVAEINRVKKPECTINIEFKTFGSYRGSDGVWYNFYGDPAWIKFSELETYNPADKYDLDVLENGKIDSYVKLANDEYVNTIEKNTYGYPISYAKLSNGTFEAF